MTIYHRLRVWTFKAVRFVRFGFRKTRSRSVKQIFLSPVWKKCDYCDTETSCLVLEGDYEVYVCVCKNCLQDALSVLSTANV